MNSLPDILILCGGKGTRLRSVLPDSPKILAPLHHHLFIDYLFQYLHKQQAHRLILCVGHLKEAIADYIENSPFSENVLLSKETQALGTGGAIVNALDHVQSQLIIVINGDSFIDVSLQKLIDFHIEKQADISLALFESDDVSRYGGVHVDDDDRISAFEEKSNIKKPGMINAGIYVMNRQFLLKHSIPFSLEKDVLSQVDQHRIYGFNSKSKSFIDIGTPESFEQAKSFFSPM